MSLTMPIQLDRSGSEPLYRQIERQVRDGIEAGMLRPGSRVPSVRALAAQLGVGRLTVATAYEGLAADGWLQARTGFGTIVAPHPPVVSGVAGTEPEPGLTARPAVRRPTAERPFGGAGIRRRLLESLPRFDLRSGGGPWPGLAVGAPFERLLREAWREVGETGPASADPAGEPLLRAAIAAHLGTTRGARCESDQVVVLTGALIGIGVAARLALETGDLVVVEEPGDPVFRRAIEAAGGRVVTADVDAHGLRPDDLPSGAALAVVSPSVQVPTGVSMPLARRVRVLDWAAAGGALIVEDGRGDELTVRGAPPACLQGMDGSGQVIHLGDFEFLLHGGVRLGYAVVPAPLVDRFVAALESLDPGPSPVQQWALGRFVADGLLDRHLVRLRRVLLDRQDAAIEAIGAELGWLVSVEPAPGGTRLMAIIEDPAWTATDVARLALEAGVAIDPLAAWRSAAGLDRELVVDYGRLEIGEMRQAMHRLASALGRARRGDDIRRGSGGGLAPGRGRDAPRGLALGGNVMAGVGLRSK
jgi:GntR family transcriptional regulator/MocR family aminotransferase